MLDWQNIPGIPVENADISVASCPERPFFLQREFLEKYWTMAALPPEQLPRMTAYAEKVQTDPEYRCFAWHFYRHLIDTPIDLLQCDTMPETIPGIGEESGMFYLLCTMSLIPLYIERAHREGFPVKYGEDAALRFGSTLCFRKQFDGTFGFRPRCIPYMLHYLRSPLWRIGRFDFVIQKLASTAPVICRKGTQIIALCADGWFLGANNDRVQEEKDSWCIARIVRTEDTLRGIPVDLMTGLAKEEEVTLDLKDGWEIMASPGDWSVFFHIPGGGGMTPALCNESFREAKEFFKNYFPDKELRLIWSVSWIFNPAWVELLPGSNLAALIRRGNLYPVLPSRNPGLYFVFGREDGSADSFEAKNSLEKAVLKCYRENRLRRAGFFILPDEV